MQSTFKAQGLTKHCKSRKQRASPRRARPLRPRLQFVPPPGSRRGGRHLRCLRSHTGRGSCRNLARPLHQRRRKHRFPRRHSGSRSRARRAAVALMGGVARRRRAPRPRRAGPAMVGVGVRRLPLRLHRPRIRLPVARDATPSRLRGR